MKISGAAWLYIVIAAFASISLEAAQQAARILIQSSPVAGFQFHEGKRLWDQLKEIGRAHV